VQPFLFNLFNDPAIIGAPAPIRWSLAQLISRTREKSARANYAHMGGGSPIVPETEAQARALEAVLAARNLGVEYRCFLAMRYWRPFIHDAARTAANWGATEALLLPLYPQFSTTTTASSLAAWSRVSAMPARTMCCYPMGEKFAAAHAGKILDAWRAGGSPENPRVLFSAHGLPERVIAAGDPYQWQVERSAAATAAKLPANWETRVCYQSRVGPLKWIGPSTVEEIEAAGRDRRGVIISPIAFVSEHIETLVELDIEYAELAKQHALPFYLRAKALGPDPRFMDALADLIARALGDPAIIVSEQGGRLCPGEYGRCPHPN
jgi:ferrochelatase